MMPKIDFTKPKVLLIIILAIGSILRLYNITAASLWHDEAFSALLIRYPFSEMIDRIILDVHPPLYYILLRLWDILLGDSLLSLRLFSAFFSILTIYFTYLFVKIAFRNENLSLISAAFIAINPFQIQYATEARMYTLGTFLIMFSSWALVRALESQSYAVQETLKNACSSSLTNPDDNRSPFKRKLSALSAMVGKYKWWIVYGISAVMAIYTHYYLIFSVAAQALFIILLALKNHGLKLKELIKSENIKGAIFAYVITFLLFLPWLPILLKQLSQVEANYWIPAMDRYSIPNTILHIFSGTNIYTSSTNLIVLSIIFLSVMITALVREKNYYKWLVAFSFLIPFVIAIVLSFKRSLYLDRYFVFTGLFYIIIIAIFVESITNKLLKKILLGIFIISSILLFARGWQKLEVNGKTGMAGTTEYLFKHIAQEDKVYVNSSYIYFTYKYYAYRNFFGNNGYPSNFNPSEIVEKSNVFGEHRLYPEYMTPLLYTPGTYYSEMPHFSGTALLMEDDTINDLNKNRRRGESVWIVWTTGFESEKPEVPKNWVQMDEKWTQDIFDYRGWIVATKYRVQ